jgi:hypothetical protein
MADGEAKPGTGRPPSTKSPATIEREAAVKAFRNMVIQQARPFFLAQAQLAKGNPCFTGFRVRAHSASKTCVNALVRRAPE